MEYAAYGRHDINDPIVFLGKRDSLQDAKDAVHDLIPLWTVRPKCMFSWTEDLRYICIDTVAGYVVAIGDLQE